MDETGAKISALDELTSGASGDLITLLDISDNDTGAGAMSADGTNKKMTLANLVNSLDALGIIIPKDGWTTFLETVTYSSVDDPTGVVTVSGDYSGYFSAGMRIKFDNGGNTIYGIITVVSYSAPNTTLTFLHEIDPTDSQALTLMANSAITNFYYSPMKAPQGFPMNTDKWSVSIVDAGNRTQATPTNGTWYNLGTTNRQISIPIGVWEVYYKTDVWASATAGRIDIYSTLSTANNTASDSHFTCRGIFNSIALTGIASSAKKFLNLTSKVTYYLNYKVAEASSPTSLGSDGTNVATLIRATSAYL